MKSQIIIILTIIAATILSCIGKTEYTTPKGENVVPKDSLESMIYDVHLADAIITSKIMKSKKICLLILCFISAYSKSITTQENSSKTPCFTMFTTKWTHLMLCTTA
jgi:hypothetical protein